MTLEYNFPYCYLIFDKHYLIFASTIGLYFWNFLFSIGYYIQAHPKYVQSLAMTKELSYFLNFPLNYSQISSIYILLLICSKIFIKEMMQIILKGFT